MFPGAAFPLPDAASDLPYVISPIKKTARMQTTTKTDRLIVNLPG